jgi:sugar phosphate isomerase/epimerase
VTSVAGSTLPLRPAAGPAGWEAELLRLARCGFEAFDLVDAWLRVDRLSARELAELRAAADAAGLDIAGLSVIRASVIDPRHGEANLERTLRALEAAAALGAPVVGVGFHRPLRGRQLEAPFWMVPHPEDDPGHANVALAARRLGVLCERAAELRLELTLELHESTLLDRSSRVLALLDAVAADNLGVNLDIGNLIRTPFPPAEPWRETVERLAPHVNYWHLKNYVRLEDSSGAALTAPCPLGDGELDYRWAVAEVLGAGYRGPLCVEHYGGDALWAMSRGREYLQALLAQLEVRA